MSGNYPKEYSNGEKCDFTIHKEVEIEAADFSTEDGFDFLNVNGEEFSGGNSPHGVRASEMKWESDTSLVKHGWKLCPRASSGETSSTTTPAPLGACPEGPKHCDRTYKKRIEQGKTQRKAIKSMCNKDKCKAKCGVC
jgi:hypothetical protein